MDPMPFQRLTAVAAAAALVIAGLACGSDDKSGGPSGPVPELTLDTILTGLDHPLFVTTPPGDPRLFIVQRTGKILILKNGALLPAAFLDISGQIDQGDEQGILGMAFAPDYATSKMFVVHYIDPDLKVHLARFHASNANPN